MVLLQCWIENLKLTPPWLNCKFQVETKQSSNYDTQTFNFVVELFELSYAWLTD